MHFMGPVGGVYIFFRESSTPQIATVPNRVSRPQLQPLIGYPARRAEYLKWDPARTFQLQQMSGFVTTKSFQFPKKGKFGGLNSLLQRGDTNIAFIVACLGCRSRRKKCIVDSGQKNAEIAEVKLV